MIKELLHHEPLCLLGLVAVFGFYMGHGARKLRLPTLIGFMMLGVVLGPSVLHWFEEENLESLSFITEVVLGFVAFGIGAELSLSGLRKLGSGIVFIIVCESFAAFFMVFGAVYLLTGSLVAGLLFGALAPASAPAGTVAVIQEYRAKGNLTRALYAVVGFDDGLAILIFGFAAALAKILLLRTLNVAGSSSGFFHALSLPALEIAGSLGVGTVLGFVFCWCIRRLEQNRNLLIITFGFVFLATGLSEYFHLSLILTNMMIGFVLVNTRFKSRVHRVNGVLQEIMPLLFLLFFTLAGAHLEIDKLPKLGLVGLVYIAARSAGLMGGSRIGASMGHVEEKVKKYIGLGILSQAGVAIGLALIVRHEFAELMNVPEVKEAVTAFAARHPDCAGILYHPGEIAASIVMTITATCIVFEIIGPILTKIALTKAGEIPPRRL